MTGMIDHRCSNFSHGIVSQNCLAKHNSDSGEKVLVIVTGTFVEVHSIRGDDVLFCIVEDNMQVDVEQMVCKKADIISVPENLWGPLFTVKKAARLSLVKDSKTAESIGNISVGDTVQVLGPDNSVICIANVTFRNSIERLGVGIYFGVQVLSPKENLSTIIKKVSLLEPGTKGFPRGCDMVVSIDKILPTSCSLSKEKSGWNLQGQLQQSRQNHKDKQKQLAKNLCFEEEPGTGSFKSGTSCSAKDKLANNFKKIHQRINADNENSLNYSVKKVMNSGNSLNVGDEVIYLNSETPERGVVRWTGFINNSMQVGVEFDNPIGSGRGTVEGVGELFRAKYQHALFVPPMALIKVSDFYNGSKENPYVKKNNNNINNNNNNNSNNNTFNICVKTSNNNNINNGNEHITSSDFCCSGQQTVEEKLKKSRKVSTGHQCSKHEEKNFDSDDLEEEFIRKDSGISQLKSEVLSWKSLEPAKPNESKMSYKRNCNSVDSSRIQCGSDSCLDGSHKFQHLDLTNYPMWNPSDLCALTGTRQEKTHSHCCPELKVHKCSHGEEDLTFQKINLIHFNDKTPMDFEKVQNVNGLSWVLRLREMSNRVFDDPYIPLPVIEQSLLAKKSNLASDEDGLYDVPPRDIRRASCFDDSAKASCPGCSKDSFKEDFYKGRRHTLAPSVSNQGAEDFCTPLRDKWESQQAEPSSIDEQLKSCCEPSKLSPSDRFGSDDLGKGSVVELSVRGEPHYGVIRWIGTLPDSPLLVAGVEMEEECSDFTDGTYNNKRYFQCNPKKALFVPLNKCRKDSRFMEESLKQNLPSKVNYGQIDCPVVEGTIPPINTMGDIELICGKNRGIQGHHNSCYLDATLFSMFAFTSVFDSLLYRPPTNSDIPQYVEVQRVLREEIVNPLRKNLYVRADRVMKLRTLLEKLSSISGLTSEEKDPEEFLNSLLAQILKAEPFLKLSSGQEAFHYQLFVEKDERLTLPSVQLLFEQSFVTSDIKLKQVPSCLIIQMPRFGKSFKMYSRILPPQLLDITDIIENSPRQCTVCGKLAEYECKDCFGQQGIGNGLESISFCKACLNTAHNHHCRSSHNARTLTVPLEFYEQDHCVIPRLFMELFAVVCIETSHYVAFVKCGSGSDAPWCFFDSMADRKGEQNGYNIPEMVPCPDLPYWLSEEGAKVLNEMQDERQLPEHAKRLFSDAYMCMYQSPDLMMYR